MIKSIAFYHPAFPGGGAERITLDIVRYLEKYKDQYEVYVITQHLNDNYMTDYIRDNVAVLRLPDWDSTAAELESALTRLYDQYKFNIFVQVGGEVLPGLRTLADKYSGKIIFANHSAPTIEMEQIIQRKRDQADQSLSFKIFWLLYKKFEYTVLGKARKKAAKFCKRLYDVSDCYTVLCDDYKRIFERNFHLGADNKIIVMHNPEYEVQDVSFDKKKIILYVGRLNYFDKRPDRLLRIWKRVQDKLPDYELKIVGDGPERDRLPALASKLKLHRIFFEGYRTDVPKYYREASISCLTSTTEGWPLCLTEAQANAVIPVAFACSGGIREVLGPSGTNGFLVRPFSNRMYARTLLKIARMPEAEKLKIRHNVVAKSKTYSVNEICEKWRRLFDSL